MTAPHPGAATAALIERLRRHRMLWPKDSHGTRMLTEAIDELARLSDAAQAGAQATVALVAQQAETERRCAQIRHLQDGLRDALAENRRKDETIERLRESLESRAAIFRWLLGEEGEFPESLPGRRYNFRGELRKRLAALAKDGTP